ncbi:MAG: DUF1697 domain-containing protein [Polyangiales bacterium]
MPAYVALLRGINVGGRHSLKMATLREVMEACGATHVETYIQSGNVVFGHAARSAAPLQTKLAAAITKAAGFPVPVVLRTGAELAAVIATNPFAKAPVEHLHVMFCAAQPAASAFDKVDAAVFAPERWSIGARELYLHLPNGMGTSKLAVTVSRLAPLKEATARNWRTVQTLAGMIAAR